MHFSSTFVSLAVLAFSSVDARHHRSHRSTNKASLSGHSIDFGTYDSSKTSLSDFFAKHRYQVTSFTVGSDVEGSLARRSDVENVDVQDGVLRLKVKGQNDRSTVSSGELQSLDSFKYGTLTAFAKATPVDGVCQGIFFYKDDNNEIDIELLSSYYTEGLENSVPAGLEFTNQPLVSGGEMTNAVVPFEFDPTKSFHNYTIKWTSDATRFYVDGIEKQKFTENIPQVASKIILNNWSNGDPNWSAGPPKEDAYFLIKSLTYTPL